MKKQLLTLALLAVAGTAGAQTSTPASQVPNGNFEGSWAACKPWTGNGKTKEMNKQPEKWTVSNVPGLVGRVLIFKGATNVGDQQTPGRGGEGNAIKIYNAPNSFLSSKTVPGYMTLGKSWSTSNNTGGDADGGTFGGISFVNKPDALRFYYKRSHTGTNTRSSVIAYLWNGSTSQENVPSDLGEQTKVTMADRDVNVLGKSYSQGGNVTNNAKLIAKIEYYTTETPTEWTECIIPFEYVKKNAAETPAKFNIIFAASDYFNSTVTQGVTMYIDDVDLVYYHTLKSATYDGQAIENFAENTLSYDLSSQVYDEKKFDCTVKGIGAEAVRSYDEATGLLTVTVNGNNISDDATSKTVYTFQFKKVDYTGMLSALSVNGKDIENFAEGSYHYTVVGDYTDGCVTATTKGADDVVATNYDATTRIYSINVTGGSKANTYFVKFAKATTDYKGKMSIAMAGELLSAATSTVGITTPVDGKADFQLLGFELFGGPIGDIFVTDVPYVEENGVVTLYKEQTITIFGDNSENMGLIDLPVVLTGTLKDGKLTANIGITWNGEKITVDLVPLDATSLDLSSNAVDLGSTSLAGMKADMTNKNLTIFLPEATEGVDAKESNVVVGTAASSLSLTDGNDWGVTKDFTAAAVSYDRVFKNDGNYVQSFVLPFGFTVPAGTTVAELSSVNGDNLVFKPVATTEANKPYLVVTNDKDFINKLTNVQVKATTGADLTTTVDNVSHIGSYTAQNVENVYGYANGKFVKATTGSVKPFRTYVKVAGLQAAPMAFGVNIEGTVTGINNATTAATAKEAIYNLQGVRVSGDLKHLTKGVYIVNGQKVVVK
ncbi:calycin-like domain-containing protein [Prevotellamassilia timonensis]|uniref:calycin-like domain-containing protein n=1 Tax=Prevotellamassilia timonensis TaxID=1852370 RepID=UPI00307F6D00